MGLMVPRTPVTAMTVDALTSEARGVPSEKHSKASGGAQLLLRRCSQQSVRRVDVVPSALQEGVLQQFCWAQPGIGVFVKAACCEVMHGLHSKQLSQYTVLCPRLCSLQSVRQIDIAPCTLQEGVLSSSAGLNLAWGILCRQ